MKRENKKKGGYSIEDGSVLLKLARMTIAANLGIESYKDSREKFFSEKIFNEKKFNEKKGVFVTLQIKNTLRGCIGNLEPCETIRQGVINNAINAAFHDPRFAPLSKNEFNDIDIEVSLLSAPEKLEYSDKNDLVSKLRPGVDGVIIRKGRAGATFLPQVWDQVPDTKDFLSHLCRKAHLASNEWEKGEIEVKIYHVQYFKERP